MHSDAVSMTVPDVKHAGKRFRLDILLVLHAKYEAECDFECSYQHFCKIVKQSCSDVVKPNCKSWGTCLCDKFLNPELKLEGLRTQCPELSKSKEHFAKTSEEELENFLLSVKATGKVFKYLEWIRAKPNPSPQQKDEVKKASTYLSDKIAYSANSAKFAKLLRIDLIEYRAHHDIMISQFR